MFKSILIAAASGTFALSVLTAHANYVEKSIPLKDGSTVHVFPDGKMGMENRFGRAVSMTPGHVMEARDGTKITMTGNEEARLSNFLSRDNNSP